MIIWLGNISACIHDKASWPQLKKNSSFGAVKSM